jgi:hypothetical protein
MNIIFQVNGGIGKCIASTAVLESLRLYHPNAKIISVSGYPEVYMNNPNVDRAFAFDKMSYFYNIYIEGKDSIVFAQDPYLQTNHIYKRECLIETWCKMLNCDYFGQYPRIYLTDKEMEYFGSRFVSEKPIMLIQPNGGGNPNVKYSWARDLPSSCVKDVILHFKNDYNIVHIKREEQQNYDGCVPFTDGFRSIAVLISLSQKRLLIDSFCQHAAAALNKPSSVCWIANDAKVFGYSMHDNIVANQPTKVPDLRTSYLTKYDIIGIPEQFPYDNIEEIFDTQRLIDSLNSQ